MVCEQIFQNDYTSNRRCNLVARPGWDGLLYNNTMRKILLPFLALLWLVFVLVLYYSGHKPAEPEQFLAVLLAGWRLLVAWR